MAIDPAGNVFAVWLRSNGAVEIVQAARYSASTGAWSQPMDLSAAGQNALGPRMATDSGGNATAIWSRYDGDRWVVQASRYAAASDLWSVPVDVSDSGSATWPELVTDPEGNATAAWSADYGTYSGVEARRYSAESQAWGAVVSLSASNQNGHFPRLAVDAGGNLFAVWLQQLAFLQVARFSVAADTWSAAASLSAPGVDGISFEVVTDAVGNAVVLWEQVTTTGEALQAARYAATSNAWRDAETLDASGGYIGAHHAVADAAGNIIVVWRRNALRAARFVVTADAWAPAIDIPASEGGTPRVVFDPLNNAMVVWTQFDSDTVSSHLVSSQWLASPAAPDIGIVAPSPGTLSVAFTAPTTTEPLFAPINYAYSVDNGATWTLRDPPSISAPLVIGGLTDFVPYTLRLLAINGAGAGLAARPVVAMPGPVPAPPLNLVASSVTGNTVTLSWAVPGVGAEPTGYVLEGGINPGEVLASISTGGVAPRFTFVAPTGTFYVRIHALAGLLRSVASNEIRVFVNVPAAPSPPANLLGMVNGSTIALSWTNTFAGGAPTSVWLNVAGALTTALPLPMGEAFTYANVPPGIYTLSVSAANAGGVSAPSNAVTLTFPQGCTGVPAPPEHLQTWKVGTTIFLSWSPPDGGPAVTSYTVWVGGSYAGSFGAIGRTLSGAAAPGSYVLSVTADNACGVGAATPMQTVVIP
jgi:hypothetical protein